MRDHFRISKCSCSLDWLPTCRSARRSLRMLSLRYSGGRLSLSSSRQHLLPSFSDIFVQKFPHLTGHVIDQIVRFSFVGDHVLARKAGDETRDARGMDNHPFLNRYYCSRPLHFLGRRHHSGIDDLMKLLKFLVAHCDFPFRGSIPTMLPSARMAVGMISSRSR